MAFSTIQGSGGAPDSFVGTSGVDTISIVNSTGNFYLGAQGANDVATIVAGPQDAGVIGGATMKGGQGSDTFLNATAGMVFTGVFWNGNADADTLTFQATTNVSGSTIQGGQGADVLTSGAQISSILNGNRNADTLTINGVSSNSSFFGGQGTDTINVNNTTTSSVVNGDNDNDFIAIAAGVTLTGSTLFGGQGNDSINTGLVATLAFEADGGEGNDQVFGTGAADTLRGSEGNDTVTAGAGTDLVDGGAGNDSITGGLAADSMTGAAGVDRYALATGDGGQARTGITDVDANGSYSNGDLITFGAAIDVITDFVSGTDTLDVTNANVVTQLNGLALNGGAANNDAMRGTWNGTTGVFTVQAAGTDTLVLYNAGAAAFNGAGNDINNYVVLVGTTAVVAADFV